LRVRSPFRSDYWKGFSTSEWTSLILLLIQSVDFAVIRWDWMVFGGSCCPLADGSSSGYGDYFSCSFLSRAALSASSNWRTASACILGRTWL